MINYVLPENGTHFITPAEAAAMISLYRDNRDIILKQEYAEQNILCNSETFAVGDVQALLNQSGCQGLRIYYGMKEDLTIHAILVGTDESGNDLVGNNRSDGDGDLIIEEGKRCPPQCPDDSILNP
jgi:hypothetical protein